jgi:hypothetical protein
LSWLIHVRDGRIDSESLCVCKCNGIRVQWYSSSSPHLRQGRERIERELAFLLE